LVLKGIKTRMPVVKVILVTEGLISIKKNLSSMG